jgi:hypothetical protein
MDNIFGGTMNTESSSARFAASFEASSNGVNEGFAGSSPVITKQDEVASVSYKPGDVATAASSVGETSVSLPVFTPKGTMGFQEWAINGWDSEGGTKTNPGKEDYRHEPAYPDPFQYGTVSSSYKGKL